MPVRTIEKKSNNMDIVFCSFHHIESGPPTNGLRCMVSMVYIFRWKAIFLSKVGILAPLSVGLELSESLVDVFQTFLSRVTCGKAPINE